MADLRYDLDRLGWHEFETLVQSLLKAQLGLGIEAWGGSGDHGKDAYCESALCYPAKSAEPGPFIFQCKFVTNANSAGAKAAPALLAAVRAECKRLVARQLPTTKKHHPLFPPKWKISPKHYILFTNVSLAPEDRETIKSAIRAALPSCEPHIHDGTDICAWLIGEPNIISAFPQLLSLAELRTVLGTWANAEVIARSATALEHAVEVAKVFVPTSAYFKAGEVLAKHHFVVLEGPPEMGKTAIGRMLSLSRLAEGWEVLECRTPSDIFRSHVKDRPQVYIADDFFGRTEYDPKRVTVWQDDLSHVLRRLDSTHWLILTTRAHLLNLARDRMDIADDRGTFPTLGEVVVDAGDLSTDEKARILYRHAKNSDLNDVTRRLIQENASKVTHNDHFTPERIRRLVNEIVPQLAITDLGDSELTRAIGESLSDPTKGMRLSFRALPAAHKWLLYSLVAAGENNWLASILDESSQSQVNRKFLQLCPADVRVEYAQLLSELSESFIRCNEIADTAEIEWIHPSCRDLVISELAIDFAARRRFLELADQEMIRLATSSGGGAKGNRSFPLLKDADDWGVIEGRCLKLLEKQIGIVDPLVSNLKAAERKGSAEGATRLRTMLTDSIIPRWLQLWQPDPLLPVHALDLLLQSLSIIGAQRISIDTTGKLVTLSNGLVDVLEGAIGTGEPWEIGHVYDRAATFVSAIEALDIVDASEAIGRLGKSIGRATTTMWEIGEQEMIDAADGNAEEAERGYAAFARGATKAATITADLAVDTSLLEAVYERTNQVAEELGAPEDTHDHDDHSVPHATSTPLDIEQLFSDL